MKETKTDKEKIYDEFFKEGYDITKITDMENYYISEYPTKKGKVRREKDLREIIYTSSIDEVIETLKDTKERAIQEYGEIEDNNFDIFAERGYYDLYNPTVTWSFSSYESEEDYILRRLRDKINEIKSKRQKELDKIKLQEKEQALYEKLKKKYDK